MNAVAFDGCEYGIDRYKYGADSNKCRGKWDGKRCRAIKAGMLATATDAERSYNGKKCRALQKKEMYGCDSTGCRAKLQRQEKPDSPFGSINPATLGEGYVCDLFAGVGNMETAEI